MNDLAAMTNLKCIYSDIKIAKRDAFDTNKI